MQDDELRLRSNYLESKRQDSKAKITEAFDEYKKLLNDTTHPDNQTAAYDKVVAKTLERLMVAASELDDANPGEGIFGLLILSLRSILKVKNENVKLQVEVRELKRELKVRKGGKE
jgi:hypothetical protein